MIGAQTASNRAVPLAHSPALAVVRAAPLGHRFERTSSVSVTLYLHIVWDLALHTPVWAPSIPSTSPGLSRARHLLAKASTSPKRHGKLRPVPQEVVPRSGADVS